ncbi:MAG: AAA family ATPase [Pyrinomonadaceae bacterium]|nr:AAA family ATPase [Pyrinomonadaceae bacterium]
MDNSPSQVIRNVPRIEHLRVKNFRVLKDLELREIKPLSVFLGRNGSGKSTVFDVFAFLADCFSIGLRKAVDSRGRFRELRTRGSSEPIVIEIKYRENKNSSPITYHLAIDENEGFTGAFVKEEWLSWRRGRRYGQPFRFLNFSMGRGQVISGEDPDESAQRIDQTLSSPEILAVNALGQLASHPRVTALREFITGWYLSYLTAETSRNQPEAGPQEKLSVTGDNLANVIQYYRERHPEILNKILNTLSARIPHLEKVEADMMPDGRLLLQIKDAPFARPIQAKYVSDGTLKMLAYLTVLYDPNPPQLVGIEEPENHLYPHLLPELADECRIASANSQLMVSTHSPFFVNNVNPEEVFFLFRDKNGFAKAEKPLKLPGVKEMLESGANLGDLWMENYLSEVQK